MGEERADAVAIMAAIIYAGRTGESGQVPNEKAFGLVAVAQTCPARVYMSRGRGKI
jgi:hypothetical protein